MSYELFQQGPAVYIPIILLSLVITVVAYGTFHRHHRMGVSFSFK